MGGKTVTGKRVLLLAFVAAVASACATSGATAAQGSTTSRSRRSANVISEDELATVTGGDLYTAIQRLRPNFLLSHGMTSINLPTGVQVFIDNNSHLGDVSALRQINVSDVKEVQYFPASEATQRFGTGVPNGAILVTRKN